MNYFRAGQKKLELSHTYIMGILNVTPDSFSDAGKYFSAEQAISHAKEMIKHGADIIDVGGQSTRPNHVPISANEEWGRIEPVLKELYALDVLVSVDTYYPEVARKALDLGADIINDVTGFGDEMFDVVESSDCGCVIMYSGGDNGSGIIKSVKGFFEEKLERAESYGICRERLCFDPGIGFGKSYEENLTLIANPDKCKIENCAYLMAASKKRVIGKASGGVDEDSRVAGTIAAHSVSSFFGADIIRVHDVKESAMAAKTIDELKKYR